MKPSERIHQIAETRADYKVDPTQMLLAIVQYLDEQYAATQAKGDAK